MKRCKAALALAVGALALAAGAVEVDGIAAKVDSDSILKSDVYLEMRRRGLDETHFASVRDEMVDRRLILKAAAESKMTIQDWVVENRVREIVASNFGGDRNRLVEMLARQRLSYADWRQRVQDDMVVSAMRWQTVDRNVAASPRRMREEYERNPGRYAAGGRVTASVILLRPEDATNRAAVVSALAKEPFADVARRFSADARAADGGVWRDVDPAEQFRPEVAESIGRMKVGETSGWIDLDGWSFLVRKDAASEAKARSFEEAYDDIAANVRAERARRLYERWLAGLRAASYVKVY